MYSYFSEWLYGNPLLPSANLRVEGQNSKQEALLTLDNIPDCLVLPLNLPVPHVVLVVDHFVLVGGDQTDKWVADEGERHRGTEELK